MKNFFTILFVAFAMMVQAQSDLIITGIADGTLSGGKPKVVELYATADIADLSIYGIGAAYNGGSSNGVQTTLSGSINAGEFFYLSGDSTSFHTYFGFYPNALGGSAVSINGDDVVQLFKDTVVVDVFGELGVDGTGKPWEYKDSWAYRVDATGPDGNTFVLANWTFAGVGALNGVTSNATATTPFPIGTYSATPAANPVVSFGSTSMTVSETAGTITIPVNIVSANANATTVTITVDAASTATSADYTLNTTTVTFPANSTDPQNVSVTIIDDMLEEGDETIVLTLSSPTNNATIGTNGSVTLTITDNDTTVPGTISFIDTNPYGNLLTPEDAGVLTFKVKLANGNNMPASVNIAIDAAMTTATEGSDFTITPTTLTFPANVPADTMTFTVTIIDDNEVELIEKIVLNLTSPVNATLGDSVMVIEIADNDATADSLVINEIMYNNPGSDTLEFLEIYNAGSTDVDVSGGRVQEAIWYTFPQGTVIPAGGYIVLADKPTSYELAFGISTPYGPYGGTLNNVGETIKLYNANGILVDEVTYDDTTFPQTDGHGPSLELCDPMADNSTLANNWNVSTNAILQNGDTLVLATPAAANSCLVVVTNPVVTFKTESTTVNEDVGTVDVAVILTDGNAMPTTVTMNVDATSTAQAADYTVEVNEVTFAGGVSTDTMNFKIKIENDAIEEVAETIVLTFSANNNATNGAITQHVITINPSDDVATEDVFEGQVKVFPNPATNVIHLETALQVDRVSLLNVLGQEVAINNVSETSFDVSELAEGVYFLEVTSGAKTGTFQVIVK